MLLAYHVLDFSRVNLAVAWVWIVLGFVSGLGMGLKFQRENWLGGYSSWPRRLYRLGHISFFGLAAVNLMFYFTARFALSSSRQVNLAAELFVLGAVTMPACCVLAAHWPRLRSLFAVPVVSLVAAASITLWEIVVL